MVKTCDLHARVTEEEHLFLKNMDINKSRLVRNAIRQKMQELPINLERRKEELLEEIKMIDIKLDNLSKKQVKNQNVLNSIVEDFIYYDRQKYSQGYNISWIKQRYENELEKILMTPHQVLEKCLEEIRKKGDGKHN